MCLAIPGKVLSIDESALRMARVAFGAVVKEASLNLLPKAQVGDYVLIHAGMGLQIVDEASAQEVLAAFAELDAVEREMQG